MTNYERITAQREREWRYTCESHRTCKDCLIYKMETEDELISHWFVIWLEADCDLSGGY